MANEPTITLVGNVGGDPELKFLNDGRAVASFSVAVTPSRKVNDQWQDGETMWFRCAAFGYKAEEVAEGITKGQRVTVTGALSQNSYEAKDGSQRSSLEVIIDNVGVVPRRPKAVTPKTDNDPWS